MDNPVSAGRIVGVPTCRRTVFGLTSSVALEYAERGIRFTAVAPSGTATDMMTSHTQEQRDALASLSAMKRIAEPDEIAHDRLDAGRRDLLHGRRAGGR